MKDGDGKEECKSKKMKEEEEGNRRGRELLTLVECLLHAKYLADTYQISVLKCARICDMHLIILSLQMRNPRIGEAQFLP